MLKKLSLTFLTCLLVFSISNAQTVKTPPASKKAAVTEYIGLTKIYIAYSRPSARERTLFGENGIVPWHDGNAIPWRAGANENTMMYFANDVTINGQNLPAGKYGFHTLPTENEWTLIFSKNHSAWGSYNYDAAEDALRVTVKPSEGEHVEWLRYQFVNQTANSADVELAWGTMRVQFTVDVDVHAVTAKSIEQEIDGLLGFSWQGSNSAAQYFLNAGKDYETGLKYAERAANPNWGGQANFTTLATQAQLLDKMGKNEESAALMEKALPMGSMRELHFYARSLIQAEKPEEAMKIFQLNKDNNPEDKFTTLIGLARGNMAIGKYEVAAKHFWEAAPNAPQGQQPFYEKLAKQCEEKI